MSCILKTLKIERVENRCFCSNTFIVYSMDSKGVWLVDCGDFDVIDEWLRRNDKELRGIFITHCHFDHIYGINKALAVYPKLLIYATSLTFQGMRDERMNGSRYTEYPFVVGKAIDVEIEDGDLIELENIGTIVVYKTPGHSPDSCCFKLGHFLFTGDTFIPNVKVVTKVKGGDKLLARQSVDFILHEFPKATYIKPGHGEGMLLEEVLKDEFNYV